MLRPKIYITFTSKAGKKLQFDFANSVTTDESYEHLTDTAKIIVPQKLSMEGNNLFVGKQAIFKREDQVKIEAGYDPNKVIIFQGYITKIGANTPVVIECEDSMFLLKKTKVTYPTKDIKKDKSKNIALKDLIDAIIKDTKVEIGKVEETTLGSAKFSDMTPAQVLEKLRDDYGLYSYFTDNKLYVGFANNASDTKEAKFVMEEVVINSEELNYQEAENIKIKITAKSMLPGSDKPLEVSAGDADGEQRTFHYYGITDKAKLQEKVDERLKQVKYTGFTGSLVTLGEPYLRHGDRAQIVSNKLPERDGIYLIKSVKRSFTIKGGYRQTFELGAVVEKNKSKT